MIKLVLSAQGIFKAELRLFSILTEENMYSGFDPTFNRVDYSTSWLSCK